ncbi:unnamed protein product, partial [Adineta steineri]
MIVKSCFIILFLFFTFSYGKPIKGKTGKSHAKAPKVQSNTDALKFLNKFGYNQCSGSVDAKIKGEKPLCQSSLQTMIEHFQTFYRLPVTGRADDKTVALMNKARCGLGDYPLACSAFRPWPNSTLKWTLNNEAPKLGKDKTRSLIQEAFGDWARYAPLKFREAEAGEKTDFSISFQTGEHDDGYPFDGSGGTLAHAFFPTDGKVHFDATEDWTDKYVDGAGYNFRLVASHQIGHALGLPHSRDPKSLMFPFYQLIQPQDLLPKDDRDGIRALYATSATNKPTTFRATTVKTTAATKKTTTQTRTLSHDRCAGFLDVVFGGSDGWLYTLDYDIVWRNYQGQWDPQGLPITDVFPGAEPHMMAGIVSPVTKKIYLFKGRRVWRFSPPNTLDSGFPKHLFGTGTPFNPVAALYEEKHIWLLKGGLLFKFHEDDIRHEDDKPPKRLNEQFPGVPADVRTAFTYEGKHYFFTEPDRKV